MPYHKPLYKHTHVHAHMHARASPIGVSLENPNTIVKNEKVYPWDGGPSLKVDILPECCREITLALPRLRLPGSVLP